MAHDLWITERCWSEHLALGELSPDVEFDDEEPVLRTFRERRRDDPAPDDYEIRDTGNELFKIRIGQRWRGATWFDAANSVVFLVAVGKHESLSDDDFYKWVTREWRTGTIRPTERDYIALRVRRERRWVDELASAAPSLLAEARALAYKGQATGPLRADRYELRLLACEIEPEQFCYALCIDGDERVGAPDYVRALAITRIVAAAIGLADDLEPRPVWRFEGREVAWCSLAFELD